MKRPVALLAALALCPVLAMADQCAVIPSDQAVRAAGQLFPGRLFFTLCEPCGERWTGQPPRSLRRVALASPLINADNTARVMVNGSEVDIAYVFVRLPSGTYANLALLSGCPTQGVSTMLPIGSPNP